VLLGPVLERNPEAVIPVLREVELGAESDVLLTVMLEKADGRGGGFGFGARRAEAGARTVHRHPYPEVATRGG
jgi:hypothetical protein